MWIRPNFGTFAGRAQFFRPDVALRLVNEGRAERLDHSPTDEELQREREGSILTAPTSAPAPAPRRRRQR